MKIYFDDGQIENAKEPEEDEQYRMDESDHINKSSEIIHQSRGRRDNNEMEESGLLIHDSQ
jgi:hypothetical protein